MTNTSKNAMSFYGGASFPLPQELLAAPDAYCQNMPNEAKELLIMQAQAEIRRSGCDIPPNLVVDPRVESAFYFGSSAGTAFIGKRAVDDGNVITFGGSGSGKTSSIVLPTLTTWHGPIFGIDFKGDMIGWEMERSPEILFLHEAYGNDFYFDPFDFLRKGGENHVIENARELAEAIIPIPPDIKETFWLIAARAVLTGAIVYYFHLGLDFIGTMIMISTKVFYELVETIKQDTVASLCLDKTLALDAKSVASISTEINNHISIFATDTVVQNALSTSDKNPKTLIQLEDLEHRDIFLRVGQESVEQWSGVIRMILVQLMKTLGRRPERDDPKWTAIEPTLLMLDEFPHYGKMDVIPHAMERLRSKRVTFALFCQSLADLNKIYGQNTRQIIMDNCPYQVVLSANTLETQEYFSKLTGSVKTANLSVSANYNLIWQKHGYNIGASQTIEPAIFPEEFGSLKDIILFHPYGSVFCRVAKETWFHKEPPIKIIKKGDDIMPLEERVERTQEQVEWLEHKARVDLQKKAEAKRRAELQRKLSIGQLVTKHFPELLDLSTEGKADGETILKPLEAILYMLSTDSELVKELKDKAEEMSLFLTENHSEDGPADISGSDENTDNT